MRLLFSPIVLCVLLAGCTGSTGSQPRTGFDDLEARLLAAENISFDFRVVSEGVIDGDLQGSVSVSKTGGLTIDATGNFIGRELQMQLLTAADSLRMVTSEMSDTVERPADLFRAVVVGVTRMGIMHNLATLSTVSPPEHADGGIAEWVTVDNFGQAPVGEYTGTSFEIFVEGERTSEAVLAMVEGLPALRRQVVDFPGGSMIVTEEYNNFVITP